MALDDNPKADATKTKGSLTGMKGIKGIKTFKYSAAIRIYENLQGLGACPPLAAAKESFFTINPDQIKVKT